MTVRIRLEGSEALQAALREASGDVRQAAAKAVTATAVKLRKDVVRSIQQGPASGVTYYRIYDAESGLLKVFAGNPSAYGPAKMVAAFKSDGNSNLSLTHQASAPGQAPMSDTGRLASSIEFDQIGPLTATVGSNLIYAKWLEYGTRKMAPRPFFRPAVERMRKDFSKRLEAAISGALR